MTSPDQAETPLPIPAPPVVLIRDLTEQLVWPRLLRTPAAALWPSRLVLGILAALLIGVVGGLSRLWSNAPSFGEAVTQGQAEAWGRVLAAALALSPTGVGAGVRAAQIDQPADLLGRYPVSTPVLGAAMLVVLGAFGGAIARSVGVERATRRRPSAASVLGWSVARLGSTAPAVAWPLLAVGLLLVVLRGLGWLGFSLGGVDVVAAALAPVLGLLGIALLALVLGLGLGGAMVVPARMVEDSDAIDAVQRALAYTLARPLRLAVFAGVTIGAGALGLAAMELVVGGGWSLAMEQAQAWLSAERRASLAMPEAPLVAAPAGDAGHAASPTIAARVLQFWGAVPSVVVAGYGISVFFTGATGVYLAMRRVCDGQDEGEVQGA